MHELFDIKDWLNNSKNMSMGLSCSTWTISPEASCSMGSKASFGQAWDLLA